MVGCGGSNAGKPASSISIEMSEFKFDPTSMIVFANQEVTLNLTNNGAVVHDFTILNKGTKAAVPFDKEKQAADILVEFRVEPNKSGTYKFTLPEAGDYSVICAVQGHMESGMVATMTAVNK
ncbi:MAG TPA: cupredoxin domain-containing protein [Prolixibacteraceae bacterium]